MTGVFWTLFPRQKNPSSAKAEDGFWGEMVCLAQGGPICFYMPICFSSMQATRMMPMTLSTATMP